jgi:ribonucleoside-diphosphate reductase alpha chain
VSYVRDVSDSLGHELLEVNQRFETMMIERDIYDDELIKKVSHQGSIQDIKDVPKEIRNIFVTALDIAPEWHVRAQAAFQKYTDNAVSKTINFPNWATPDDVEKAFMLSWKLGCKGVTIYRYGSREKQVLTIKSKDKGPSPNPAMRSDNGYSGGCPHCSL